jgi:hypothetical protein
MALGDHGFQDFVHLGRSLHRGRRLREDGHQAVSQRLDHRTAVARDRPGKGIDAMRDHRGRFSVAQRLEQRSAASQIGEQDGAIGDLGHSGLKCSGHP